MTTQTSEFRGNGIYRSYGTQNLFERISINMTLLTELWESNFNGFTKSKNERIDMANTYSQIYIQVVFAVYGRENLIKPEWKDEVYKYITGIVKNKKQKLIAINGVSDHIHILLGLKPNYALSDMVQEIKANSSRFINEKKFVRGKFTWQEGFGAFSYSDSQLDNVIGYIQHQEEHHKKKSFREEYKSFLRKFKIDFEDKYLFDWIE